MTVVYTAALTTQNPSEFLFFLSYPFEVPIILITATAAGAGGTLVTLNSIINYIVRYTHPKRRFERKVNEPLALDQHHERWHNYELFVHTDLNSPDEPERKMD